MLRGGQPVLHTGGKGCSRHAGTCHRNKVEETFVMVRKKRCHVTGKCGLDELVILPLRVLRKLAPQFIDRK